MASRNSSRTLGISLGYSSDLVTSCSSYSVCADSNEKRPSAGDERSSTTLGSSGGTIGVFARIFSVRFILQYMLGSDMVIRATVTVAGVVVQMRNEIRTVGAVESAREVGLEATVQAAASASPEALQLIIERNDYRLGMRGREQVVDYEKGW